MRFVCVAMVMAVHLLACVSLLLAQSNPFGTPNFSLPGGPNQNPPLVAPPTQIQSPFAPLPNFQSPTTQAQFGNPSFTGPSFTGPGLSGSSPLPPGVNFQLDPNLSSNAALPAFQLPSVTMPPGVLPPDLGNFAGPNFNNLAQPSFDPFTNGAAIGLPGQVPPGYPNLPAPQSQSGGLFSGLFGRSNPPATSASTLFGQPQGATYGPITGYQNPGLLNNPDAYGNQTWSAQSWQRFWQQSDWQRLFHAFRFRHTYLNGGDPDKVEINDTEVATSLSFPNWLGSRMPLTISPGAVFHNWQGPDTFVTGDDLPATAYSAYLSFDHSTALNQQFGAEGNFTIGAYSSFDTFTSDTLRFTGLGLIWIRLSPTVTLKLGAEYLDRLEIKLLPAGGIFWTPDPNTRLSLYFPRPKLSRRLPNLGNLEVWGYLSAEYGGGSWTVRRVANFSDQVDLNDYRIMTGLEWIGVRGGTGFAEVGFVFDRELMYRSSEPLDSALGDTLMFRGGFAF